MPWDVDCADNSSNLDFKVLISRLHDRELSTLELLFKELDKPIYNYIVLVELKKSFK